MRIIKDNEELQSMIVNGRIVIDDEIQCNFNILVNADIEAYNIEAWDIEAGNIEAWNIKTGNIKSGNINACNIEAWDINAGNIDAGSIKAGNIKVWDINAGSIDAGNIDYFAICVAYQTFTCTSVNGRRENAKHFCLDSEIVFK